ncbi:F-box/kelch-repeat protein At2g44130-like [Impatiens glandulifera]|uniref:F-box/kelch-repeat protein At2g44130-like n=1 Tax=Impatiens glandulifera TaxID=253017 RepID=UPI001FB115E6|nr:F-box/kelch-repeat protein At2g44130-like [Impatiens glandulifera]
MDELDLIPGLPEELGVECLARLHYKARPSASRACRRWLNLLETPQFYSLRKQLGFTNHMACLLQSLPPPPSSKSSPSEQDDGKTTAAAASSSPSCVITVFDPATREWDRLPHIPNSTNGLPLFCQIASSEGKLVLMGGWDPVSYDPVSSVFVFDFVTRRWRRGKDMPSRRSFFAIGAVDCKVLIAGGHDVNKNALDSAWAYDVRKDEWSELPKMSHERDECEGLVIGDEFWVISGYMTEFQGAFEASAEVYNLETQQWRRVESAWTPGQCPRSCARLGKDGRLTSWSELDSSLAATACGVILGAQSLVMGSAHQGSPLGFYIVAGQDGNLERMDVPDEFSGFVQSICCVQV